MSGAEHTFGVTKEDVRKMESRTSAAVGGDIPKGSSTAAVQSIVDERKPQGEAHNTAKLPKPDPPPGSIRSDEYQKTTAGVGSGRVTGVPGTEKDAMREPTTAGSAVREDGEMLHKHTDV